MASPPAGGITFTRSTAIGLLTPFVAGLFPSSDGESSSSSTACRNDRGKKPNSRSRGGRLDSFTYALVANRNHTSTSSLTESNDQSEELDQPRPNLDRSGDVDRLAELWGSGVKGNSGLRGGKGQRLTRQKTWSPPKPRKGSKLGVGPRARTLPSSLADDTSGVRSVGVEDGPDGG